MSTPPLPPLIIPHPTLTPTLKTTNDDEVDISIVPKSSAALKKIHPFATFSSAAGILVEAIRKVTRERFRLAFGKLNLVADEAMLDQCYESGMSMLVNMWVNGIDDGSIPTKHPVTLVTRILRADLKAATDSHLATYRAAMKAIFANILRNHVVALKYDSRVTAEIEEAFGYAYHNIHLGLKALEGEMPPK